MDAITSTKWDESVVFSITPYLSLKKLLCTYF